MQKMFYTDHAKLTKRDRSTVARYVSEYEAAIKSTSIMLKAKMMNEV